jgi:nucleotide-binding universal stress UspA family protein
MLSIDRSIRDKEVEMKTILVPLDGSVLAEQVLPHVQLLAPLLSARVHLLHVVSEADRYHLLFDDPRGVGEGEPAPSSWDVLRQNAEIYLAEQTEKLRDAGLEASFMVRLGSAPEMIIETAERRGIQLIAMATHGYSGLRRWVLGSVTDKVLHAATTPLLIVRGATERPVGALKLKRIMLTLDGSALARQAVPFATELASSAQAELVLFSAVVPPLAAGLETMIPSARFDDALPVVRDRLLDELDLYAAVLREHKVPITPLAVAGLAAESIVDEAAHLGVDLIVMPTHGASGLRRWAVGSIAEKVLHATSIPLILVRA